MSDYPPGMTLRPIDHWPTALTKTRKRSPFSATLGTTLSQLDVELRHLGNGKRAPSVLQIAMRERDFRIDGMPYARAVAEHPGVILTIESQHGPLCYPCDTFTKWQDNLRAIALGLEALRRVERYGITQTGQQYRGWLAIEATSSNTFASPVAALKFLADLAGQPDAEMADAPTLLRPARGAAHPDRHGGDHQLWDRLATAVKVLRAYQWLPAD